MTPAPDKRNKTRLDLALVELGLFASRQEAQTAIMDGAVLVNNEKVTKSGTTVSQDDKLELRPGFVKQKYVSRGGFKLEKAIEYFQIDVKERVCLDVGASTGGFTDCLLVNGATQVYAIDVGYGQLDWKLRNDPRVVSLERVNARHLTREALYKPNSRMANLAVIDCSFISLDKILPAVVGLLMPDESEIISLIKPQFEAGREQVKKGVIKDPHVHAEVLKTIANLAPALNLHVSGCTFSPLKGPKGNIEYLMWFTQKNSDKTFDFDSIAREANQSLNDSASD